jgi:hypothetical protein
MSSILLGSNVVQSSAKLEEKSRARNTTANMEFFGPSQDFETVLVFNITVIYKSANEMDATQ